MTANFPRRWLGRLAAAGAAFLTAGALSFASAQEVTLTLATDSGSQGDPAGDALDRWAALIEEKTGGAVVAEVFYQNQLGGQQEVFDKLVLGEVDAMLNWPMTSYDKRIGVLYTPYMVFTWEEALEAYKPGGWLNGVLGGLFADLGLHFFGAWPEGFNGVATRGRYATSIADAEGLKVRTPPMFPFAESMEALGYQTAQIDWSEVYTSIQTGVVDGDSGNVIFWDYEYFRDQLDYYVQTKHMFVTGLLLMNMDSWEQLSAEQQQAVTEAAVIVMEEGFASARERDEKYIALAQEAGMEYITLTDEQLRELATTAREKVWPVVETEIGSELMTLIRENASAP